MKRIDPLIRVTDCLDRVAVTDDKDRVLIWNSGSFFLLRLRAARYCKYHVVRLTADQLRNGIPTKIWNQIEAWCKAKKGV